jgi:hypothetical protein
MDFLEHAVLDDGHARLTRSDINQDFLAHRAAFSFGRPAL